MSSLVSSSPRRALNARQAETVERLLSAGAAVLEDVGPDALTIRSVAQRAGVSPATAYTYFASKHHLFAEIYWRHVVSQRPPLPDADVVTRLQAVTRHYTVALIGSPHLAAAANIALLGSDPEVERLRVRIGGEFVETFAAAIGDDPDPRVLDALVLAFSGALLQAGMGLMTQDELADRLDDVVAVIMEGHR